MGTIPEGESMCYKIMLIGLVFMFFIPSFTPLEAITFKGVTLDDSINVDGQTLVLNGVALRKKFVFKVYVAGLYLSNKEKSAEKILGSDTMRRGIMHFLRSVDKEKITEAWYDGLKANTPAFSQDLKKQFDLLCSWMENMSDGSKLSFTYIPGKGTSIDVKGKNKGIIPGKNFADALFSCWIGPKPGPGDDFKKALLNH